MYVFIFSLPECLNLFFDKQNETVDWRKRSINSTVKLCNQWGEGLNNYFHQAQKRLFWIETRFLTENT